MKESHGISHREFGFVADYKISDGKLKDVDFKVIYMVHRGPVEQQDGNMDTLRIITEVPFNIF